MLRASGWKAPDPPRFTNWSRTETTTSPDVADVAQQAVGVMRGVFGLGAEDKVFVKMFGSPLRGNTPASPRYEKEADGDRADR